MNTVMCGLTEYIWISHFTDCKFIKADFYMISCGLLAHLFV